MKIRYLFLVLIGVCIVFFYFFTHDSSFFDNDLSVVFSETQALTESTTAELSILTTKKEAPTTMPTPIETTQPFNVSDYLYDHPYEGWVYATAGVLKVYVSPDNKATVIGKIYTKEDITVVGETNYYNIISYSDSIGFVQKEDFGIKGKRKNTILQKMDNVYFSDVSKNHLVLIGASSTTSPSFSANRNNNLKVSSEATSIVVKAGSVFSFNQTTGPRTTSSGYLEATTLDSYGNTSSGIGGGVCQTASTIHVAVLDAISNGFPLKDLESNLHSAPVSYLKNRDYEAMVSWAWSDFKFKNNSTSDIVLEISANDSTVSSSIYTFQQRSN